MSAAKIMDAGKGLFGNLIEDVKDAVDDWHSEFTHSGKATNLTEVKVNVEEARAMLKKIQAKAEQIRESKERALKILLELDFAWEGESAQAVKNMCGTWYGVQEDIAKTIEEYYVATYTKSIDNLVNSDQTLADYISKS